MRIHKLTDITFLVPFNYQEISVFKVQLRVQNTKSFGQ